jgi:hypothetical protein
MIKTIKKMSVKNCHYILRETLIAMVANALFSALFIVLVFSGRKEIPMWGLDGMAFDFLPHTFMLIFMSTLMPGFLTRKRIAAGKLLPEHGNKSLSVNSLFKRGVLLGIIFTLILAPTMIGVLYVLNLHPMKYEQFMLMKVVYGFVLGIFAAFALKEALLSEPQSN